MKKQLFLYFIFLFYTSICISQVNVELKTGDLLFQTGLGSNFEKAVTNSTMQKGSDNTNLEFSHIGVVYIENDSIYVLEAIPYKGVCKTRLEDFIKNSKYITVGRLKKKYSQTTDKAIKNILSLIGKPYDFVFSADNDAYYCSELIEISFIDKKGRHIFETIPMTFKDKSTGKAIHYWEEYFKKLNCEIPEGQQGTNPMQIYKSKKIFKVSPVF